MALHPAADGPEFLPPPEPGIVRSVAIAVLAHVVLALALSWGIRWNQDDTRVAVEAELWSPTVQQAAPKPVEAPPPPPPPPPQVQPRPEPPAPAPDKREADIALEREKERRAQEQARREEAERQRQAAEKRRAEEAKKLAEAKKQEAAKEAERQAQLQEQRKREAQAKARKEREDEQKLAQLREENLRRIQGLAGATGGPSATGTAQRSSGPSDSYAGRIRGRVRPNIVFTEDVAGNPSAEVEVRMAPDGTIVGKRIVKSSGVKNWDDAVLRALDRTEVLPRDVDGRVHTPIVLVFRPKD